MIIEIEGYNLYRLYSCCISNAPQKLSSEAHPFFSNACRNAC